MPTKPECISDALRRLESLAALSSISLNILLAVVVIRCKASELQTYSKLILCNCFADSLFAIVTYVAEIHADIRDGVFVIINKGLDLGVHPFGPLTFYLFALYFAVVIVAFPMVYRYLTICRNYRLTGPQQVGCFLLVVALASITPTINLLTWMPAWERTIVDKADVINAYPCHDRMELYISDKAGTIFESSPPCLAAFVVVNMTYATIVFCAYKVHRFLQRSSFGTNPARQSLQRQVGWALLAQAITPMFVFVLPLGAGIVVMISGAEDLRSVIVSATSFCSWIPVVNPIFTIYFIKPYRQALFGRLIAKLRPSRVAETADVTAGSFQLESIAA